MHSLDEMPSHRKGDYTEAVVVAELKRGGTPVSKPIGDNERYDIVVESESDLYTVQIKTATQRPDGVTIRGVSQHTNSTGNVYKQYDDDVDLFVGYYHETETMYLLEEAEVGSQIFLRTDAGKQSHRTTNWAQEYEFDNNWPPEDISRPKSDGRRVIEELQSCNVGVFEPTSDERFDVLLESTNGEYLRTSITPGYLIDGRIRFDTKDTAVPGPTETDLVLVHCAELDCLYLVRRDEYDVTISLRVDPPAKPNSRINWAQDYEFDARWPDDIVT